MANGTPIGYARTPFPGNIIPANRLDPNAIDLLNLYPAPNNSGLFNNYAANPVLRNQSDQFDARGDQLFGASDSLFGRVSYVSTLNSFLARFLESRMADLSLRATRRPNRGTPL